MCLVGISVGDVRVCTVCVREGEWVYVSMCVGSVCGSVLHVCEGGGG